MLRLTKLWRITISILILPIMLMLFLVGCRKQQLPLEATDPPLDTLSQQATPTSTPITPTQTPTPTSSQSKTLTNTPIPPIGERLSSLDAQEDQIHFLAYRHDCELPVSFDLTGSDPDCTTAGIITEDIILFPDMAGFQLLRVGYLINDGISIPAAALEKTIIQVSDKDLQSNDIAHIPLLEAELMMDPGQPNLLFTDIELTLLQENELTTFYVAVIGRDAQVYRVDQVAFDQQALMAFIEGGDDEQVPIDQPRPTPVPIIPTATNTPLQLPPTHTQPPPTHTQPLPTSTSTPTPTATHTPLPTITRTSSPTLTQPPPTATTQPSPTATTQPSPTATTQPSPTATTQPSPTATRRPTRTPTCRPG